MSYGDHIRHGSDQGMGGFLDPPAYPTHTYSIGTGRKSNPNGLMSLESAASATYLKPAIRHTARRLLNQWHANRPSLDSPAVQDWIFQVLGYFKGCYRGDGPEPQCWHCDKLRMVDQSTASFEADLHAGVHLIRKFYPEFTPGPEHWAGAYWGTKPQKEA